MMEARLVTYRWTLSRLAGCQFSMFFRLLVFFASCLLCGELLASHQSQPVDPVFSQINSIVKTIAGISGLKEEHAVPYGRMNKHQLHRFLSKRLKKSLRPDEIRADELSLKMFGLVPASFDLKRNTIDLLTEQAAAFYDYDEKRLFLLEGESVGTESATLAHELAHGLADQHFDLQKYMDNPASNDDANLARSAVVEGQASWLMLAYSLKEAGQSSVPSSSVLQSTAASSADSLSGFPVLNASPLYIQQSLLFPYSDGILFFDAVYKKLGQRAFREVFEHPPSDSAQILHPERYLSHIEATQPKVPSVDSETNGPAISEGVVGEFDHRVLLWQYQGEHEAKTLSPHLRGGSYRITRARKHRHPVLAYASQWDSTESATIYFRDLKAILRGKWKRCTISMQRTDEFAGQSEAGYFLAKQKGSRVLTIEGLPVPVPENSVQ
jgi:hypothetical protein